MQHQLVVGSFVKLSLNLEIVHYEALENCTLNNKKMIKKEWREPYARPQGECLRIYSGISVLVDFSTEELGDPEPGPDLTPREDIRPDIL